MKFPDKVEVENVVKEAKQTVVNENFNRALENANKIRLAGERKIDVFWNALRKYFALIVSQIAGLLIIGVDKFIKANFSLSVFLTADFWYKYLVFQFANWIISLMWFMTAMRKLVETNTFYQLNKEDIQKYVDLDYQDNYIQRQSSIEYLRRKKVLLELETKREIYTISLKLGIKNTKELNHFLDNDRPKFKHYKKWLNYPKLQRLTGMLTKEWQLENLTSYKFKNVPKVNYSLLTSGFSVTNNEYQFNTYESKVISTSFSKIAPSTVVTALIGVFLIAFTFTGKQVTWEDVGMFCGQLLLILWNTVSLLSLAYGIFESTHLRSTNERKSDLKLFSERHLNKNEHEKEIVEILDYQNNV